MGCAAFHFLFLPFFSSMFLSLDFSAAGHNRQKNKRVGRPCAVCPRYGELLPHGIARAVRALAHPPPRVIYDLGMGGPPRIDPIVIGQNPPKLDHFFNFAHFFLCGRRGQARRAAVDRDRRGGAVNSSKCRRYRALCRPVIPSQSPNPL